MCVTTLRKNIKKLKTRFFLRLRNRGFKKYTLVKLFSKITYAQRNELLKKDTPLSNVCESVTFQQAEWRMILDGERACASSQEEIGNEATCALTTLNALNSINDNSTNNATNPDNRAETSRYSRVTSPKGWILFFSPPRLFTLKILAK